MNILMCDTQYAFLQYFLMMPFDTFRDTFFAFDCRFNPSVVHNLEKSGMACHQNTYEGIPTDQLIFAQQKNKDYLEKIIAGFCDYFNGDIQIYGQDHLNIAQILWRDSLKHIPFYLLEDGIGNYAKLQYVYRLPQFMYPDRHCMGHNSRVQKIYLTGLWHIPNDLRSKVQIIDLRSLWDSKSPAEKQFFLDLYNMDQQTLAEISKKTVCYLGQSFSSFGLMPLERELSAYRKVLSNYNRDEVYIKAHPSGDNIDYKREFPGIMVIMNNIPYEVLYFLTGANLKVVASIFSTAAMCVDEAVEQHYYDVNGDRINLVYPYEGFS